MKKTHSKISIYDIATYVDCPMKYVYSKSDQDHESVEAREIYGNCIRKVVMDFVNDSVTKYRGVAWDRMMNNWKFTWHAAIPDLPPDQFSSYFLTGMTACRMFYEMDSGTDSFVASDVPYTVSMGDYDIVDSVDLMRITNFKTTNKRRLQFISLKPYNMGITNRDKTLSVPMLAYRIAMKKLSKVLGEGKINGYDYVWFDSATNQLVNCSDEGIPDKPQYKIKGYLATIVKAINNEIFYPRFHDTACSRCQYRDTCSMEHSVPNKCTKEVYKYLQKAREIDD
jgi:DNA-binding IscR family transcriptional regulator